MFDVIPVHPNCIIVHTISRLRICNYYILFFISFSYLFHHITKLLICHITRTY